MTLQCVPTVPQTPAKLRYKALSAPDFVLDKGLLNPIPPLHNILYWILDGSFVYALQTHPCNENRFSLWENSVFITGMGLQCGL